LKEVGNVTVAVVTCDSDDIKAQQRTSEEFELLPMICPQVSPNRGTIHKLRWALDPHYLNLHGIYASPADRDRIVSNLAQYDLVWILNSRTPNILQQWRWSHSHLDVDDVPSTYLRTVSCNASSLQQRLRARIDSLLLKRRELLFKHRFTTLSVCSEVDRQYLGGGNRIHVIPNGFERPQSDPVSSPANPPRIGFIGLCSYFPNIEGVRWFLRDVWPRIRKAVPGIRFRLVGKHSDRILNSQAADVDVLGWIADPSAEIAGWSAMVIPIRLGGGTRVKVADAFSRKCPVVSTSFGAFGYEVKHERELLLADSPDDFAAACISLLRDPKGAAQMADWAYRTFLEKWTWDAIAPRVWAAVEDCLRRSASENSSLLSQPSLSHSSHC
jgi:glycosyltransferase involved in cell wall biosynthesis